MRRLLSPLCLAGMLLIAPLALAQAALAQTAPAQKKSLTLPQALGQRGSGVSWFSAPPRVRWAPDGVHYVVRKDSKSVWVDPATGAETKPPAGAAQPVGQSRRGRRGRRGGPPSRLRLSDNDLYYGEPGQRDVAKMKRLTTDGESKRLPTMSPDNKRASFVRGANLVVIDVASGAEWKVSADGDEQLFYGVLDWVYQEELYGRGDYRAHWWSGDSKYCAFLRLDESPVKTFTIVDFVPAPKLGDERSVEAEFQKYPKAGDPNPTVKLFVAEPATQKIVEVALENYAPDVLVVRVGWTPGGQLLFAVQNRIQTWLDLNTADPKTGAVTNLLREESKTWVNRLPFPRWRDDGTFLWFSERTGYQHIYHYEADGKLVRAVTSGEWQVSRIERIADSDGKTHIWFVGTKDGAIDSNLYRVGLDGEGLIRLTRGPGRHSASLNKAGTWFLDTVSSIEKPAEVRLCKGEDGSLSVLGRAEPKDQKTHVYSPKAYLRIEARDGYALDATLIKPPNWEPKGKYPIYLPTYSGPDAPSVRNAFSVSTWQQYLAQRGCLVLQVNVRSASGRGQAHTGLAYKRLGVIELQDLIDAVDHVVANYGGDPDRVAIDGWSYGGFMAGYALTHSKKFSLGIAGAGVHDWQLYDTIYTERYMSTPQKNPEGYKETSVLEGAKNLHGHLVILHGGRDDNVHLQNSMRLVHELQRAGKDSFEFMVYPRSRHGVASPHRRGFIWRAIRDHLLAE